MAGKAGASQPSMMWRERVMRAKKVIARQFKPDESRQGILGISMGAKQALAVVLKEENKAGFNVLGLLSGMFQDPHLHLLKRYVYPNWRSSLGSQLSLYFHYCGKGDDIQRTGEKTLRGDRLFFPNNQKVCAELTAGAIRTRDDGLHNWEFWRLELEEFLRLRSHIWRAGA